ncbi:MAG: dihydrodipicolinate synthase family protein [Chloroflexota bacterium]|nr:dihydrodipicolinate synthase family protein [Chloroflexota bacterium]
MDNHATAWRGVFTIPCTPFDDTGALDLASLAREIEFCVDAGAHGIVGPVNASEAWTLTDDERRQVSETIVETTAGRIPVVVGVSAGSAEASLVFMRHANEIGADAVIALPPTGPTAPLSAIHDYYRRLGEATSIPIFIQNHDAPYGTRLPAEFVAQLIREVPFVDWVKEETVPSGHAIAKEIELAGTRLQGVMGGIAGRYLFDEYRRGACGTMPACEVTDLHVLVWNALDAGDEAGARHLFSRLLPLLNFEARMSGVYKAVLKRRGVIASDYMRHYAGNPLDELDRVELDAILDDLRDLYTLAVPEPVALTRAGA